MVGSSPAARHRPARLRIRRCAIAVLLCAAVVACAPRLFAQDAEHDAANIEAAIVTAPVEMDGHTLFRVRGATSMPADVRAARISGRLAAAAAGCRVVAAYPGLWLRDDVYATHGHFLDRHLTVPSFERMGIGVVERLLGIPPDGADPLDSPENPEQSTIEDYERVQAPVYSFLTALAESGGSRRGGANPSARVWEMVGDRGFVARPGGGHGALGQVAGSRIGRSGCVCHDRSSP